MATMNVGIIGCGNISTAYLQLAPVFASFKITACADLNPQAAAKQAAEFGCQAMSIDELLADPSIGLVLNLTVPNAHFEVSSSALRAGKHVYSEKPFVLSVSDGQALLQIAAEKGLRVGSAPDTFLGGSHQAARQCIDSGVVGDIIGGSCYFQSHGMENWHPDPTFFFQPGGGPVLDMGAYYISNLVQFLGPVKSVVAMAGKPFASRTVTSEPNPGSVIDVNVDTSVRSILQFDQGAQVSFTVSWDVWAHEHNNMELYGTKSTLFVPDPNRFGHSVRINDGETESIIEPLQVLGSANFEDMNGEMIANYRGIGLADMVAAIDEGRPHRCSGELSLHVIEVMTSILESAESRQFIELSTSCSKPEALDDTAAKTLMA
ncbi:oxidoreductase [Chromatiales bacterium (ex Bugula neritina AB1)]|nr:oxidoreductase [Chromatiales bacterium (ex Bugula neritina AB1)]